MNRATKATVIRTPWLAPAFCFGLAVFFGWNTVGALRAGQWTWAAYGFAATTIALGGARIVSVPRLVLRDDGLGHPVNWWSTRISTIPWIAIDKFEFKRVTGFAAPILLVTVRGRRDPVRISFPAVPADERRDILAKIDAYIEVARRENNGRT